MKKCEESLMDWAKKCEYVIITDKVTYYRKNSDSAAALIDFLLDEKIEYVLCSILEVKTYSQKKKKGRG